jgi:hypothetical protein
MTTAHLFAVPAARYAFWVDRLAWRAMGTWQAERFAAQLAYDLPVDFLATGDWLAAELRDLRPDARCFVVPRGVDPQVFSGAAPGAAPGGSLAAVVASDAIAPASAAAVASGAIAPAAGRTPLRVVVDDRHAADPAASDERAAVAAAAGPLDVVYLEAGDAARDRAAKLARADVVLMLSPVEGALGGPLEGFLAGATCIVAPAPDAADLVRHDENGIVADPDDVRGTARWLDQLAADPARLVRLRRGAQETGSAWPSTATAADRLFAALEQVVAEPPPARSEWPVRLMGDAIGGAAVFRQEIAAMTAEVNRLRGDQAYQTAVAVRERFRSARLGPLRRLAGPLLRRVRG